MPVADESDGSRSVLLNRMRFVGAMASESTVGYFSLMSARALALNGAFIENFILALPEKPAERLCIAKL